MKLLSFSCLVFLACNAAVVSLLAQDTACMGAQSYSHWVSKKGEHPDPARAKTAKTGFKRLKLGMSFEQVNALMPRPDWSETSWNGCTFYYATSWHDSSYKALTVRLNEQSAIVNGLGKETFK